jgi:PmbA protein
MQRDYWYTSHRDPKQLDPAEAVGRHAGERAVRRLGSRKLATTEAPVLFEANVAGSLIGSFVSAASGSSLYRRSSFLLDRLGQPVFSPNVTIVEDPHRPGEMASTYFDAEGVATAPRTVVQDGVLNGWFLSAYSARKLGLETTGNAGGNHNLVVQPGEHDLAGLLERMGRGLLVTELLGQGVNAVTGDYSRGAAGFWVEGGEIAYPVEEITIAGNLLSMYQGIQAVGRDVLVRGSRSTGSILIDRMTIAGN